MSDEVYYNALKQTGYISADDAKVGESCWLKYHLIERERLGIYRKTQYFTPLSESYIRERLPSTLSDQLEIMVEFETGSTNHNLLQSKSNKQWMISVAERQISGRGRRGKAWQSPLMVSLYFSFRFNWRTDELLKIQPLSLLVGGELISILRELGIAQAMVKWPNDIWVDHRKLAGILIETAVERDKTTVVIGIGLNNQTIDYVGLNNNRPISVEEILGAPLNRNDLIVMLIDRLTQLISRMKQQDLMPQLRENWPLYSLLFNQDVGLWREEKCIATGIERGINDVGALLIEQDNGDYITLQSSEYSLRPKNFNQ